MKTTITYVGPEATELIENGVIIMFNETAPQELRECAIIHEKQGNEQDVLHEGGKLIINNQQYNIDFVGDVANKNFNALGHLSVYFNNNSDTGQLPGSIFVSGPTDPKPSDFKKGNTIEFI